MTLRIGWIGCGTHATQMLLPQLVRLDVELAALCDVDPTALAATARRYGVARTYGDARELIASGEIDAVGMAVGPEAHAAFAEAALERGLPVYVEKPPAATAEAAERLRLASERAGKPVVVGFMKRFSTGNRIASNILRSGRFGRPLGLTGYYMTAPTYFSGDVDYTGFFLHHCVHSMDLAAHLVSPIQGLAARKVENGPGRLLAHVTLDFECGAVGTIALGTVQSRGGPVERVEIMGDHQRLEIENVVEVTWRRDPPFKAGDSEAALSPDSDALTWKPNFTAAANEDHKGYHALLVEAVKALRGEPHAAPTAADGATAMRWLERLREELKL